MNDELYTVSQAAQVLDVAPERVRELIAENKLEVRHDEETDRWLISARSVHARLKGLPPEPPEARGERVRTQGGKRADFWVLLIIAAITLLAAGYTLITAIGGN